MNAQAELNKILGSVTSGIGTAIKVGKSMDGKDLDMAKKARINLSQKIKAIKQNKSSTEKARTKLNTGGNK